MSRRRAFRAWAYVGFFALGLVAPVAHAAALDPTPAPPAPIERRLANGLRVAVFPRHRLRIVQIELLVGAGQLQEPAETPGVALLTSQMLLRGSSSRDAAAFRADAARLGGTLTAGAARDAATVAGAFLARDFSGGLELMSDAVRNPLFGEDELRGLVGESHAALDHLRHDPAGLAEEQLWSLVYAGHPYGRPVLGADSTLDRITSDALRRFHHDRYRPDGSLLIVAGDVDPDSAFAAVEEWFGAWSGRAAAVPAPKAPVARPRVRVVDVPGAPYSVLRLGLSVPGRGDADDLPLSQLATRFGGGESSALRSSAIVHRIGAGASGHLLSLEHGGLLSFGAAVANDSVASAAALLRDALRTFLAEPRSTSEIESIRRAAETSWLAPFESVGGTIVQWAGLDLDPSESGSGITRRLERIRGLTAEELQAAAGRTLDPSRLSLVALGPASQLVGALKSWGDVEVVSALPVVAAPAPDSAVATPEAVARGRAEIDRALTAHGGLDSLRAIHDSIIQWDVDIGPPDRITHGKITQERLDPDQMSSHAEIGLLDARQVLNGNSAWSITPPSQVPLDGDSAQVAGLKAGFASDLPHLLLPIRPGAARVAWFGTDRINGRVANGVDAVLADGQRRRYWFEADSHLLMAIDYLDPLGRRQTHSARRLYGTYRTVGNIRFPGIEDRMVDGERNMRWTMQSIRFNVGILTSEFSRPGSGPSKP